MLGGCTTYAAKSEPEQLTYDDIYDGAVSIHNHLIDSGEPGIMMSMPSFLMVNQSDDTVAEMAKRILEEGPAVKADWGKELAYLRTFGVDFFGRAGCEIRQWYDEAKAKKPAEQADFDMVDFVVRRVSVISLNSATLWHQPSSIPS